METKFKLSTKIGQKVYLIEIGIRAEADIHKSTSSYKHGIEITELKIVYQSDYKIALSDNYITCLTRQKEGKRKESYERYLEDVSVRIKTKEDYFPNGVFCSCYTLKEPKKVINQIKREMIKKINEDYGFLRTADFENILAGFEIKKATE